MAWLYCLIGVVLEWLLRGAAFLAVMGTAGGCSLAASWSAPSQQQVTDPQQPVTQTTSAESPQTISPPKADLPIKPLTPVPPAAPVPPS